MNLNELSRIGIAEINNEYNYWAMYHHIYELFTKVDNRHKLLLKYKKMLHIMKPGMGRGALTFFYRIRRDEIDNELSIDKVPGVRAVYEFEQGLNPYKNMRLGSHRHKRTNSKAWKVLQFIHHKGTAGASLTEIQHYIYVELNGNSEEDFWETSPQTIFDEKNNKYKVIQLRKTRGYWGTNLYGSGYFGTSKGLLATYCKKNDKGKWIIKRWPEYNENLVFKKPRT